MADLPIASDDGAQEVEVIQSSTQNKLAITSAGAAIITQIDGYKATYAASIVGLVAALVPTDIFTLTGSATKTIRITRLIFSGTENTAAIRDILLIKRSTANSGGTSTAPTIVPYDSTSAAATATVLAYTVNPTLGTTVGTLVSVKLDLGATNLTSAADRLNLNFGTASAQSIVLRGTSQVFAVNLNGVTAANNSLDVSIEWTEE